MTQEEKAKAYDKVREKIALRFGSNVAEEIFSEYEESEDERIRKALINGFNKLDKSAVWYNGITNGQILAWLEKQGEHAKFRDSIQVGDKVTRNRDGMLVNLSQLKRVAKPAENKGEHDMGISEATKQKLEDNLNRALEKETSESCNEFLEKQSEQKSDTDFSDLRTWKYIVDAVFTKEHGIGNYLDSAGTETIAKELQKMFGDIKQTPAENKGMYLVEEEMTPFQKKVFFIVDTAIEEEQGLSNICNELLALAKKEIEQNHWSEEDERMLKNTIALIETLEDYNKAPDGFGDVKFWLKSLKDRYTWKPSEEQIKALDSAIHCYAGISPTNNREVYALEIMKEQLKKLREKDV